jgi:drug/metabolite transporter (DMT)-like permease
MISATDQTSPDHARAMKGVLYGFASFAIFAFSDASVKLIRGELPPYESAFFGAVFGLLVLPFQLSPGDRWSDVFVTSSWTLWVLRFLCFPVGVIGSVTAFTHLSMAEAFVLIFLLPAGFAGGVRSRSDLSAS